MKDVLIISTGGTIVSLDHGSGAVPDAEAALGVLRKAGEFLRGSYFRRRRMRQLRHFAG